MACIIQETLRPCPDPVHCFRSSYWHTEKYKLVWSLQIDLIVMLRNGTGCIFWYRNISEDYVPLYIGDGQVQIQNFFRKRQMLMELCEGVTAV